MESCYWMFGQYDGLVIFELPAAQTAGRLEPGGHRIGRFQQVRDA